MKNESTLHYCLGILQQMQNTSQCEHCGNRAGGINVVAIDGNFRNILPTNLEFICEDCTLAASKLPFVTVTKRMSFAAAHHLPGRQGKCNNLHGHEWVIEVSVGRRVDPTAGMALDFSELKEVLRYAVIDTLDHRVLNDYVPNPTAENLLVWAWEQLAFNTRLRGLERITLWESSDSCATFDSTAMLELFLANVETYETRWALGGK